MIQDIWYGNCHERADWLTPQGWQPTSWESLALAIRIWKFRSKLTALSNVGSYHPTRFWFLIPEGGAWIAQTGLGFTMQPRLVFLPAHPKCSMHLNGRQACARTICFSGAKTSAFSSSYQHCHWSLVHQQNQTAARQPFQDSSLASHQLSRSPVRRLSHIRLSI